MNKIKIREKIQEEKNKEINIKRQEAYPPIGDQLDVIMKWLATETEFNTPTELKSIAMKCMAVKSKYPKGE